MLDVVGEWWTLLIVRDALLGARRFEEFCNIGIAENILSARLDRLVQEGILERRAYQEHPRRHEYVLSEKGRDLLPVIAALGMWGLKWVSAEATPQRVLAAAANGGHPQSTSMTPAERQTGRPCRTPTSDMGLRSTRSSVNP
jgi:DNA-binding HxlR family transcriptional regulator